MHPRNRAMRAAATLSTALVGLGLVACSGDTEPERLALTATVSPAVDHYGATPQPSTRASATVTARVAPAVADVPVSLERRDADGSWSPVDEANTDGEGLATLAAPGRPGLALRVVTGATEDWAAAEDTVAVPRPAWVEEFQGRRLSERWAHRGQDYNPDGSRRCSRGSEKAVSVGGGVASMSVLFDRTRTDLCTPPSEGRTRSYRYRLNANVQTVEPYTFGTFAARIRFQRSPGQHGAFWLQTSGAPGTSSVAEDGAEIDVVEHFGESRDHRLASFVYYVDDQGVGVKNGGMLLDAGTHLHDRKDRWWRNYHVFSLEWTEDEYVVRIDGEEAWRTDEGISHAPEFVILSMLSSDYELRRDNSRSVADRTMDVDWVAYWPPD